MQLTSAKQIPSTIRACADAHHLGTPRIVYETPKANHLYLFAGPLAILVGTLILSSYALLYDSVFSWWPLAKTWPVIAIGVIWLLVGLWILLTPLFSPTLRLFLCPKGLIYVRRTPEVIRWDQIVQVSKTLSLARKYQAKTTLYKLTRTDGKLFALQDSLPHMDRLYLFIEKEVARHLLPTALTTLQSGNILTFANLTVSSAGIALHAENRLLPWTDLAKVQIEDATLSIYASTSSWAWLTLSISDISNAQLLKNISSTILQHLHQQTLTAQPSPSPSKPAYIQAYDAGFTLFFGKLGLSITGISINGSEENIPWHEIKTLSINESEVIIQRQTPATQWYTFPLWSLTDIETLKDLTDYILLHHPS